VKTAQAGRRAAPAADGAKSLALFLEEQNHLTPGLQNIALLSKIAVQRGKGSVITDVDGRDYIDLVAGIGVASIGHAHPEYVKQVSEQLSRISVGSFTTEARLSFARRLARLTPRGLDRVQLYSGGSEAVEAAIRLAKSRTKKHEVVGFWGGFHGKTGGVLGLLGSDFKFGLGPLMPGLYLSPYPNPYRCPLGTRDPHDCAAHCLDFLRSMIRAATTGAIAAVIAEPIQGTAGNVMPPRGWLAGLKEIARENGALLISDEMITGFGRTGRWFGCQHEDVVPDIMTIGKGFAGGFPVSGLVTTAEIAASSPFAQPSGSSSSYGGNPLASAAADATTRVIEQENLVEHSRVVGERLLGRFRKLQDRFPFVGDVRGRGLLIGVDLVKDRATKEPLSKDVCRELFMEALKRGLLTMCYSPSVRINPPLNIPEALADRAAGIFEESLEAVARRFRL